MPSELQPRIQQLGISNALNSEFTGRPPGPITHGCMDGLMLLLALERDGNL